MVGACSEAPRSEGGPSCGIQIGHKRVIEGFAVETKDGLIFTVKGLLHPPERLIAYIRYAPDPAGRRRRDGKRYRRLYHFDEQEALLKAEYPDYAYHDPILGLQLQGVPHAHVTRVFDPRKHLASLREQGPHDPSEEMVLELDELLQANADVPPLDLGISGSVMLGLHRPESDIDLVVYGERASREVHGSLSRLLSVGSESIRRPNARELRALHAVHQVDTPLSFESFEKMQQRKVNELRFSDRELFLRFVRDPAEVAGSYGDERYESVGTATIEAQVSDDDLAIFTPCRYGVENVSILAGASIGDLRSVISFRGRFSDQAVRGEIIEARGRLERVRPLDQRRPHHRLVIGGRRGDYLVSPAMEAQAR